jgi:hypothetical protein
MYPSKSETPTISIITAVCDDLPLIERALRSIRARAFAEGEWLVVDDGSTDGTSGAVRSWAYVPRMVSAGLLLGNVTTPNSIGSSSVPALSSRFVNPSS